MTTETTDTGLPENEFDLAFEAAASDEIEVPEIEAAEIETPEAEIEEEVETPEVEPEPESETPEAEAEPEPEVETPAEDPVKKVVTETVAEIEARKQSAKDEADAEAKKQADAEALVAEAAAKENLTEAEVAAIEQMKKDFPEVAEAFEAQQRVSLAKIENAYTAKLNEAVAKLEARIAPIDSATQSAAQNAHQAAILAEHKDAFDILPDVEKWVAEQPSFLQPAYNDVLDNGSSEDVVKFISMFKEATGSTTATTEPVVDDSAAKAEAAEKEAKLQAQEGVRSRRTSNSTTIDPNDFDGAFEKFATTA